MQLGNLANNGLFCQMLNSSGMVGGGGEGIRQRTVTGPQVWGSACRSLAKGESKQRVILTLSIQN